MRDPASLAEMASGANIAVLPLGATEFHGPHLPAETDTIIAEGISARLAARFGEGSGIAFLPVEPVGYSPEHLDHPATRSHEYQDALGRWIGIGEALADVGVRKLLLMNAHGGNSPLMTIVATELRVRRAMLCVATSWTRFEPPAGLFPNSELALGIHAGAMETSVMLALAPERVDLSRAGRFSSFQEELTAENRYLRAYGRHAFGWKMSDLNSKGAVGNARDATAQKGEALISNAVEGLAVLVEEMRRFDLSRFDPVD